MIDELLVGDDKMRAAISAISLLAEQKSCESAEK